MNTDREKNQRHQEKPLAVSVKAIGNAKAFTAEAQRVQRKPEYTGRPAYVGSNLEFINLYSVSP
jgi:hypothetical protein